MKSTEKYFEWKTRLAPLDLKCVELTGDAESTALDLRNADVM